MTPSEILIVTGENSVLRLCLYSVVVSLSKTKCVTVSGMQSTSVVVATCIMVPEHVKCVHTYKPGKQCSYRSHDSDTSVLCIMSI